MPHKSRDERLATLLEKGDLVARYLDAHGRWETHVIRTGDGTLNPRVFVPCECPVCTDALDKLNLED